MSALLGHPIPAFTLQDDKGVTVTSQDFKGRWTVLYAYPKDSTPGCTTEACDFRDNLARIQSFGAQVCGISRDSLKSHQTFIAKQDLPFRLLSDPDCSLLRLLGAYGKKIMYGKEVEGIIRSTFILDPKGIIRHVWPKVSVKGHVEAVIEVLAALRKG
jgi:thioredoxin-dependent peroxiredoxin